MFHRATPSFSFSILASRSPRRSSSPMRARTLVHCLAEPRMSWSLRQSFSQSFLMISTARVILGCTLSFLKRTFLVLCSPPATTWSQWNAMRGKCQAPQVPSAQVPDAMPTKSYLKILSHRPSLLTTQFPCWLIANLRFYHFEINLTDQVNPFRFALVWRVEGKKWNTFEGVARKSYPAMHSSPTTVHPEKVLEAEIFSEPGVQYLHGHHHIPAVQVKKVQGWRGKHFTSST